MIFIFCGAPNKKRSYTISDFALLGHISLDELQTPTGRTYYEGPGGSVTYISKIFDALGVDYQVITHIGDDFGYKNKLSAKVNEGLIEFKETHTTRFINRQTVDGQRLSLAPFVCNEISPNEINFNTKIAIVCPILGEVTVDAIHKTRSHCKILLADVQGLIRDRKSNQEIIHRELSHTAFTDILSKIDFLKMSESESLFCNIDELRKDVALLITLGERGCRYVDKNFSIEVGVKRIEELDPTGAGDSFLAGFAMGLYKDLSLRNSLEFANFCGRLAVNKVGPAEYHPMEFSSFLTRIAEAEKKRPSQNAGPLLLSHL